MGVPSTLSQGVRGQARTRPRTSHYVGASCGSGQAAGLNIGYKRWRVNLGHAADFASPAPTSSHMTNRTESLIRCDSLMPDTVHVEWDEPTNSRRMVCPSQIETAETKSAISRKQKYFIVPGNLVDECPDTARGHVVFPAVCSTRYWIHLTLAGN